MAADLGAKIREIAFPDPKAVIDDWFPLCGIEAAVAHEATYPVAQGRIWARACGNARSWPAAVRHGLSEDRVAARGISRGGASCVRRGRSASRSRPRRSPRPRSPRWRALGEDTSLVAGLLRFTCPFDMTGSPTITLPGGFPRTAVRSPSSSSAATSTKRVWSAQVMRSSASPTGTSVIPLSDPRNFPYEGRRLVAEFHHGTSGPSPRGRPARHIV